MITSEQINEILNQKDFIENDYIINQKILDTKIKMSLVSSGKIFLYMCLTDFTIRYGDFGSRIAFVEFSSNNIYKNNLIEFSQDSNNIIYINSKIIQSDIITPDVLSFIISHELLHVILKHGQRIGHSRHPEIWNIAADHVINRTLNVKYITNHFIFNEMLHEELPNCSSEEAYEWFVEKHNDPNHPFKFIVIPGVSGHSSDKRIQTNDKSYGDFMEEISEYDRQRVKDIVDNARQNYTSMKSSGIFSSTPGSISSGLKLLLDKLFSPKIPWWKLLDHAIKTNIPIKSEETTWTNPNKLYRHKQILLPGNIIKENNEEPGTLIVVIDTSGSVGDKDRTLFASILAESSTCFGKIKLVVHDVNIVQTFTFEQDNRHQIVNYLNTEGLKGGGGTSHTDVFKWIENEYIKDPDDYSLTILLTDGYSNIEKCLDNTNEFTWVHEKAPLICLIVNNPQFTIDSKHKQVKIIYMNDEIDN